MEDERNLRNLRQRRKLTAVMLVGLDKDNPMREQKMRELIMANDVALTEEQYQTIIEMMARGQIGRKEAQEAIGMIVKPVDKVGISDLFARINAVPARGGSADEVADMKRILAYFSGVGFERYNEVNASSVATFMSRYKDALAFEEDADLFFRSINNPQNSLKTVSGYGEALAHFKRIMFGEQQEYLDQYYGMRKEAQERRAEIERNREKLVAGMAMGQISKRATAKGKLKKDDIEKQSEASEDVAYADGENGVFAVFDGAGGMENGREAAKVAERTFREAKPEAFKSDGQLVAVLEEMNDAVQQTSGMTTAILAKVNRNQAGRKYLAYASVGDSRIYILHENGTIASLVRDEGWKNVAWNILGMGKDMMQKMRSDLGVQDETGRVCLQHGNVWLEPGDRVILCSDGVTGDIPPNNQERGDQLSNIEVARLARTRTLEQAMNNLLLNALKEDDRSVIVFEA